MQFKTQHMTSNQARKMALLIIKAAELEMDLSGYGETAVNHHSGYVYLWLEDFPFTLFINSSGSDRVKACWVNQYNGEEEIIDAHDLTLHDLETWAGELNDAADAEFAN